MSERERDSKGRYMPGPRTTITPEYKAFHDAKQRCCNPRHKGFRSYGQRGLRFRFTSFAEFVEDIGPRPSKGLSLDRIDNANGHYEKGNVKWSTAKEQANNRRSNGEAINAFCEKAGHKKGYRGPCKRCRRIYERGVTVRKQQQRQLNECREYMALIDHLAAAVFQNLDSGRSQ